VTSATHVDFFGHQIRVQRTFLDNLNQVEWRDKIILKRSELFRELVQVYFSILLRFLLLVDRMPTIFDIGT
jgi:hypothetical protein